MRGIIYLILLVLVLPSVIAVSEKQQSVLDKLNELSEGDKDRLSEVNDVVSVRNIVLENNSSNKTYMIIFVAVAVLLIILIVFFIYKRMKIHGSTNEVKVKEAKEIDNDELQIMNYIKGAKHAGLTDKEIKDNLASVGWKEDKVEKSFGNL